MFRLGYKDLLGYKLAVDGVPVDVLLVPIYVFLVSEQHIDAFYILLSGDDEYMLILFQDCF